MDNISYFISVMPRFISDILSNIDSGVINQINEIRLRIDKPIIIYVKSKAYFIELNGKLTSRVNKHCLCICSEDFNAVCDRLCNNSYHTNMQTMTNGYITAKNGSRIGIASTAVKKDGVIHSVRDITSINIRISHEYIGCSKKIADIICNNGLPSIIVAGRPGCGKTTFLRDYARLISDGYLYEYKKVSIADERGEISAGFNVGINTDVLVGFDKAKGIEMAIRTLSPDLIVCDEIGNLSELNAIKNGFSSGVDFAVSVHLKNGDQIYSNKIVKELIETKQFDYMVILKSFTDEFEIVGLREEGIENCRNDNDNPFYFLTWLDGS